MDPLFTDLHAFVSALPSTPSPIPVVTRVWQASREPMVSITAVGGFPITVKQSTDPAGFSKRDYHLLGKPISEKRLRRWIRDGLGVSAVPTYMNKSNKTLAQLGEICLDRQHNWAYHWMTISMVFCGMGLQAHMAFAHDSRFKLSWPVLEEPTGEFFVVTGSIYDWIRFTSHCEDKSFDERARYAMIHAREHIETILPRGAEEFFAKVFSPKPDVVVAAEEAAPQARPEPPLGHDPLERHFLVDEDILDLYAHLLNAVGPMLVGRDVVEIGCGHGELTNLILAHPVATLTGYEIEKGMLMVSDERFTLGEGPKDGDARQGKPLYRPEERVLISNPPYSLLLSPILQWLAEGCFKDAILMIPKRLEREFCAPYLGFQVMLEVPGSAFEPKSAGEHLVIMRGFHDPEEAVAPTEPKPVAPEKEPV